MSAAGGGKFVLNLGAKRAQVEAAAAPRLSQTLFSALPGASMPFAGPM